MKLLILDRCVQTPKGHCLFECSKRQNIVSAKLEDTDYFILVTEENGSQAKLIKFDFDARFVWDTSEVFRWSKDSKLLQDDKFVGFDVDGNQILVYGFQTTFIINRSSGHLVGTYRGHG